MSWRSLFTPFTPFFDAYIRCAHYEYLKRQRPENPCSLAKQALDSVHFELVLRSPGRPTGWQGAAVLDGGIVIEGAFLIVAGGVGIAKVPV